MPGWLMNPEIWVVFTPGVPHAGGVGVRPQLENLNHFERGQEESLVGYER